MNLWINVNQKTKLKKVLRGENKNIEKNAIKSKKISRIKN